jgi:hypothetical protein
VERKIPVKRVGRVINPYGFDTTPRGNVESPENVPEWEGPKGVIKFFAWQRQFLKNLHNLRSMYNGVSSVLDPAKEWSKGDMASLAWQLYELSGKLSGMAERTRRICEELGTYHGFQVSEGGEIYPSLEEALSAREE